MFSAVEEIFNHAIDVQLLTRVAELGHLDIAGPDVVTTHRERVDRLRHLKDALEKMSWSQNDLTVPAAEAIANGCRSPEWRLPCGESGMLDFFLALLSMREVAPDLLRPLLRVVANACADTDENRRFLVEQRYLPPLVQRLKEPDCAQLILATIYNVCLGYEPAQQQVLHEGIFPVLIDLLSNRDDAEHADGLLESVTRLMQLLIECPRSTDQSPDYAVDVLLRVAAAEGHDPEDFVAMIELALVHLSDVRFQRHMLTEHALEMLLSIVVDSYSRFADAGDLSPGSQGSRESPDKARAEQRGLLTRVRDKAIGALSEISALPEFAASYPLDSPLVGSLRMWLSVSQTQLRTCACLMLGNLARSDAVCRVMVRDFRLHEPLIHNLCGCQDIHLLHAAAGFLKNLAVLPANKAAIAEAKLTDALTRLWSMEAVPQMQYAGASLGRQVVTGSYENVLRFLEPLSPDPDSPAHSRTYLSLLFHLFYHTDHAATKTEVARTATAVLRVLHRARDIASKQDLEQARRRLYQLHPDLVQPLAYLACQTSPSVVRSEGWFAFALMASSREGAVVVDDITTDIDVYSYLLEILTGTPIAEGTTVSDPNILGTFEFKSESESVRPGKDPSGARDIDRENALMLLSQLLKNRGDEMPAARRKILEDLLRGKGSVHQSFEQLMEAAIPGKDDAGQQESASIPDLDVDPRRWA